MGCTKFDYSKLLGKMKEQNVTQLALAEEIHNTPSTLSLKLNNKAYFKQSEIHIACNMLNIALDEIGKYFYVEKV